MRFGKIRLLPRCLISFRFLALPRRWTHVVKVKRIHQIGHVVPSPLCESIVVDAVVAFCRCPCLDELHIRRVVGELGEDVAASRPGRDDEPRCSPACAPQLLVLVMSSQPTRPLTWPQRYISKLVIWIFQPFSLRALWCNNRHNMVCPASLF
jgi:hypothetical protein